MQHNAWERRADAGEVGGGLGAFMEEFFGYFLTSDFENAPSTASKRKTTQEVRCVSKT